MRSSRPELGHLQAKSNALDRQRQEFEETVAEAWPLGIMILPRRDRTLPLQVGPLHCSIELETGQDSASICFGCRAAPSPSMCASQYTASLLSGDGEETARSAAGGMKVSVRETKLDGNVDGEPRIFHWSCVIGPGRGWGIS